MVTLRYEAKSNSRAQRLKDLNRGPRCIFNMTTDEAQANLDSMTRITVIISIFIQVFSLSISIFGSSRSFVSLAIAWCHNGFPLDLERLKTNQWSRHQPFFLFRCDWTPKGLSFYKN